MDSAVSLTLLLGAAAILLLGSCAPPQRMGMVVDPASGLQYGSVIERNIVVDASQFANKRIKVRIRNTSGDTAFDLQRFKSQIEQSYKAKGFVSTEDDDFGVIVDANIQYSGQVTTSMTKEFSFLGASAGGLSGYGVGRSALGTASGVASGATLGAILGSHVTDDTYIVVADVTLGVPDIERGQRSTVITFGEGERRESERRSNFRPFRQRVNTAIAVYAGGRNTRQAEISGAVQQRFVRILSDVL